MLAMKNHSANPFINLFPGSTVIETKKFIYCIVFRGSAGTEFSGIPEKDVAKAASAGCSAINTASGHTSSYAICTWVSYVSSTRKITFNNAKG